VLRSRGGESLEPNKSAHKKDSAQNDRLWAGRFNQPQDMLFDRLNASLPYDRILAPYDIRGSKVHVGMLGSIGVLDGKEVDVLTSGLDQVLAEYETGAFPGEAGDEDIHMAVERRLTEIVGPVGGKVHTGRSRNDQVALDVQLYLRDATYGHARRALRLMRVLLGRAQADGEMIMPGYTHLQRAQPVLLSHHLLAYVSMLERDVRRFLRWRDSSWMPLGAGALAGVNYALDRELVARELGFERVALNAMDAVAARDAAMEYLATASICAVTLSRMADEVVLWSTQEFGYMTLPDSWSSGSSIMPQKRNPDAAELVRGKAAGFLGREASLAALSKGLPLAYSKDLQEDKLYLFASQRELDMCLDAMGEMMTVAEFHPDRSRSAAEGGYAQATDVADYLVRKGLSFRKAHRISGRLVALAAERGSTLSEMRLEDLRDLSAQFDEQYYDIVKLEAVIAAKVSPGGTSPRRVEEQMLAAEKVIAELEDELPAPA